MTRNTEDHLTEDEFDLIELGSVSAETRGEADGPAEFSGSQNSRPEAG